MKLYIKVVYSSLVVTQCFVFWIHLMKHLCLVGEFLQCYAGALVQMIVDLKGVIVALIHSAEI